MRPFPVADATARVGKARDRGRCGDSLLPGTRRPAMVSLAKWWDGVVLSANWEDLKICFAIRRRLAERWRAEFLGNTTSPLPARR